MEYIYVKLSIGIYGKILLLHSEHTINIMPNVVKMTGMNFNFFFLFFCAIVLASSQQIFLQVWKI